MSEIELRIIAVLGRAAMVPRSLLERNKSLKDLGIGSLEQIECILALEDEFEVELPDHNLRQLRSVGDLVDFVAAAVGETTSDSR
jgi:acyl carrier protein